MLSEHDIVNSGNVVLGDDEASTAQFGPDSDLPTIAPEKDGAGEGESELGP